MGLPCSQTRRYRVTVLTSLPLRLFDAQRRPDATDYGTHAGGTGCFFSSGLRFMFRIKRCR